MSQTAGAWLKMEGIRSPADCASARSALALIQGVSEVRLTEDCKEARVLFDPTKVGTDQFLRALHAVGFVSRLGG
ncbi:MAG TPA: hypothetical protein VJU83_04855 [Burkholderiales bacterium]|nr:hypothetical protein [Burkholderiales bacterium]